MSQVSTKNCQFAASDNEAISKHNFAIFLIERILKKYTIFIEENTDAVYGVIGLYDSFADMIDKSNLPLYLEAILLPFQGKIIYDGLFGSYPVFLVVVLKEN